jgi:ABC-type multidrug transport system permease subunit
VKNFVKSLSTALTAVFLVSLTVIASFIVGGAISLLDPPYWVTWGGMLVIFICGIEMSFKFLRLVRRVEQLENDVSLLSDVADSLSERLVEITRNDFKG